ncbi:hypothetical protein J6590_048316 [Homalodisca vitripennis]|nr:hypothetical protein J6590_048316 [Homalodisca vitripennis]
MYNSCNVRRNKTGPITETCSSPQSVAVAKTEVISKALWKHCHCQLDQRSDVDRFCHILLQRQPTTPGATKEIILQRFMWYVSCMSGIGEGNLFICVF